MFIRTANRLLTLAVLVSASFQTMALSNGGGPQSSGSTPKHGQTGCSLELLTDPAGIDFNSYLRTLYVSVRQNWYAIMPPSVETGQQGANQVEFRVMQDGSVPKDFVKLTVHSGKEDLDRASLLAIPCIGAVQPSSREVFSAVHHAAYHVLLQHGSRKAPEGRFNEINFRSWLTAKPDK